MKNKDGGEGDGGGGLLNRGGGLINCPPLKREGLLERGGLNKGFMVNIETVAFTLDLSFRSVAQYYKNNNNNNNHHHHHLDKCFRILE